MANFVSNWLWHSHMLSVALLHDVQVSCAISKASALSLFDMRSHAEVLSVISLMSHAVSTAYLRSISIIPGSGFDEYTGGVVEVGLVYKNKPTKAVICDFERDGIEVDARLLCHHLG